MDQFRLILLRVHHIYKLYFELQPNELNRIRIALDRDRVKSDPASIGHKREECPAMFGK